MMATHTSFFAAYIIAELGVQVDWLFKRSLEWDQECRARLVAITFTTLRYLSNIAILGLLIYISVKVCEPNPIGTSSHTTASTHSSQSHYEAVIRSDSNNSIQNQPYEMDGVGESGRATDGDTPLDSQGEGQCRERRFHAQIRDHVILNALLERKDSAYESEACDMRRKGSIIYKYQICILVANY